MALQVANPFTKEADASIYDRFRPRYHDIPFGQLKLYLGHEIDCALDVACGTGHSTVALSRISRSVSGCDSSPAMLIEARKNKGIDFRLGAAEKLPFDAVHFSLVNISMAIHWVDQAKFISEARRVLKPTGYLTIDNYGFSGHMNADNDFDAFHKELYTKHFPPAQRNQDYPLDEETKKFGFILRKEFQYGHTVRMTLDEFIGFCMSQSNVIISKLDNVREFIRDAYYPYFKEDSRELLFSGVLKLYQANDQRVP